MVFLYSFFLWKKKSPLDQIQYFSPKRNTSTNITNANVSLRKDHKFKKDKTSSPNRPTRDTDSFRTKENFRNKRPQDDTRLVKFGTLTNRTVIKVKLWRHDNFSIQTLHFYNSPDFYSLSSPKPLVRFSSEIHFPLL